MALTITLPPENYNFSRNLNYVEIETDNQQYSLNKGVVSNAFFTNLVTAIVNDTITIGWNGGATTRTYTFKATTTIGSLEVAIIGGGQTAKEYITQLANDLMTDTVLAAVFSVTSFESALWVVANAAGTAYSLDACATTVPLGVTWYQAGTDDISIVNRPNYRIAIELWGKTGATWEKIVSFNKVPSNGKIRCDLASYIDDYLQYDRPQFTWPLFAFACPNVCKTFKVKISEQYGDVPVDVSTSTSGMVEQALDGLKHVSIDYRVLKAGFDTISGRIFKVYQFLFYDTNNLFLTRQQRIKKIAPKQKEFLYYLFQVAPASNACLRKRFYDELGNVTEVFDSFTDPGIQVYDVWYFWTHDVELFNGNYSKLEVCVWDVTGALALSEIFTYLADTSYNLDETILYFFNSDGGMDTVRCVGSAEVDIEVEDEVSERSLAINDTDFDGNLLKVYARKNNKFTVFSGYKTQTELNYIEDLLLSKEVFMYGNKYGQQKEIPVIITTKKLVRDKTNQNLKGYVLEFQEGIYSEISQANYIPVI